jgi:type II secretory pathway pseudopilin PulG
MEMTSLVDMLLGILAAAGAWWANGMSREQKRLEILLNKTREEYATREDVRSDVRQVMEALHRVEDKLDRVLQKD